MARNKPAAGASDQTKRGQKRAPIPTEAGPHSAVSTMWRCAHIGTLAYAMHTDEWTRRNKHGEVIIIFCINLLTMGQFISLRHPIEMPTKNRGRRPRRHNQNNQIPKDKCKSINPSFSVRAALVCSACTQTRNHTACECASMPTWWDDMCQNQLKTNNICGHSNKSIGMAQCTAQGSLLDALICASAWF